MTTTKNDAIALAPLCIYTIRDRNLLRENERWKTFSFVEQRRWREGERLLRSAEADGQHVVVLFSDASRDTGSLIYAALLHDVDIVESETRITDSGLRRIKRTASSTLIVKSTGQPISEIDIRPYRICEAPEFVRRLAWRSPEVRRQPK
ncbi:MAG: hypothetical protein WED34_21240 [Planctomycetales bacterium]